MPDYNAKLSDREANLLRSVTETTWKFYLWVGFLSAVVLLGLFAYIQQIRDGLVVTAMRDQVSWGLYITDFVFFIGISHVGALLSAILRFSGAEWRRPLTRMAEAITTASLCVGGLMPVIDMGRPDRIINLFRYGRIQSPILWDIIAVTTYLTGSTIFLILLMVPDSALLRDSFVQAAPWRKKLYKILSLGYQGTPDQHHFLERAIFGVTLVILPLAISVHTVVSWIFSMTLRPGWNSSIFGPYFVVGALYSGAAAVILAMYVFRRVYHLEDYLKPLHFRNLGFVLLTLTLLYLYFNVNEYLTTAYKFQGLEAPLLGRLFYGDFASSFWGVQMMAVLVPTLILMSVLGLRKHEEFIIPGVALSSLLVVVGAWVKRYLIIVPTLGSPYLPVQGLPWEWAHYTPSRVEWAITAGSLAGFLLIYTILSKLFPIVSIWETRVEETVTEKEVKVPVPEARVRPYIPPALGMVLIGCLLLGGAVSARAEGTQPAAKSKQKPTTLSMQWEPLPAAKPPASQQTAEAKPGPLRKAYLTTTRLALPLVWFGPKADETKKYKPTPIVITAALRDSHGGPLTYQPVGFALQTSFGTWLQFGKSPTDEQGVAKLVVKDRRCGVFPFQATYGGDDANAISYAMGKVDFGACAPPSLPSKGVLITPYWTAGVALPFIVFYGIMWGTFIYTFGYLAFWRMRRAAPAPTHALINPSMR
jgi:Ni/Fe-hydrogenase subunit HybB-like protein